MSARTQPRSDHAFEHQTRADVRARRWLRWHVFLISLVTLGTCWGVSHGLLQAGVEHMAVRFGLALAVAYGVYLGLLYLWGHWLLSRDDGVPDGLDLPGTGGSRGASGDACGIDAGGGGDFGGGGASASFDAGGSGAGDVASGALEALGSADEAAVIAAPLALIVGAAVLIGAGLGALVFGVFGVEVVLGVVVEIAFASVGGALAYKARREGWLMVALRRTAWPMAGVVVCGVLLGAALHTWLPDATTLPQALRTLF